MLDRVQLEAVVARAFAELRQGELPAASVAVTTVARPAVNGGMWSLVARPFQSLLGGGWNYVSDPDRDLLLDRAAVALTRYPPGLLGALQQLEQAGTTVRAASAGTAHLWMADPGASVPGASPRPTLELRVEALRLL